MDHLRFLYGEERASALAERIKHLIDVYKKRIHAGEAGITERDAILIAYPDQVQEPGSPPLKTLADFCRRNLRGLVSGIHVLPFFPYSSDDGFSVIDYRTVNPEFGDWEHISSLGKEFRLMFDAVINHASAQSEWFQAFLRDEAPYRDYFITVDEDVDLTAVVRPRALPLLTDFETASGLKRVWTTFSRDQVDLNYRNPEVLLEVIDLLLFYAERGAQFIRLDAIAYLWKEIGTPCIHLPQTHSIVQLLHSVLEAAAPHVKLITETNVPHRENVSYFGDGANEAHLVYNFALPPLVLHALHKGNSHLLADWIAALEYPPGGASFLNFLASHDGIGLSAARELLPKSEIDWLIAKIVDCGGLIAYKEDRQGKQAYELNINFFDALGAADEALQIERFLAAHAIMLALRGVPAIYFHSLFGSRGWPEGVEQSGHNRAINREKLAVSQLEGELANPSSLRGRVFSRLSAMIRARQSTPAFHPGRSQTVIRGSDAVLALLRESPDGRSRVLCLQNVSAQPVEFDAASGLGVRGNGAFRDLITGAAFEVNSKAPLTLAAYQSLWLADGT